MLAPLLLGLLAAASAAPRYHHRHPPPFDHQAARDAVDLDDFISDDLFDTDRFWGHLRSEMLDLEAAIAELGRRFPVAASTAAVVGDVFKVTIPLAGFDEADIKVKANDGLLMVQAVHGDEGRQRSYLHTMTLPAGTDPTGSWTFVGGVLTVTFPARREHAATPPAPTAAPEHSREEMGGDDATVAPGADADVGLARGDQDAPETNEIPGARVEATTYAVDLKGDVEFVPVAAH